MKTTSVIQSTSLTTILAFVVTVLVTITPQANAAETAAPSTSDDKMGGEMRAPSPRVFDKNRNDFIQLGVGPAYGLGIMKDAFLYNVTGSYNWNISERVTVKGLADLYLAGDNSSAQMVNFAAGADYYLTEGDVYYATPYLTFDAGVGNARTSTAARETGLIVGTGAGLKFLAADLNWDANLHYSLLTEDINDQNPSVITMRLALNF